MQSRAERVPALTAVHRSSRTGRLRIYGPTPHHHALPQGRQLREPPSAPGRHWHVAVADRQMVNPAEPQFPLTIALWPPTWQAWQAAPLAAPIHCDAASRLNSHSLVVKSMKCRKPAVMSSGSTIRWRRGAGACCWCGMNRSARNMCQACRESWVVREHHRTSVACMSLLRVLQQNTY